MLRSILYFIGWEKQWRQMKKERTKPFCNRANVLNQKCRKTNCVQEERPFILAPQKTVSEYSKKILKSKLFYGLKKWSSISNKMLIFFLNLPL